MKKVFFLLILTILGTALFAQPTATYLPTHPQGAVYYQTYTLTSPVGADTTLSFMGYSPGVLSVIGDFRPIDGNDSELDVGMGIENTDTIFVRLASDDLPITIDTTVFDDKVVPFDIVYNGFLTTKVKFTRGEASPGLEFTLHIYTQVR